MSYHLGNCRSEGQRDMTLWLDDRNLTAPSRVTLNWLIRLDHARGSTNEKRELQVLSKTRGPLQDVT